MMCTLLINNIISKGNIKMEINILNHKDIQLIGIKKKN